MLKLDGASSFTLYMDSQAATEVLPRLFIYRVSCVGCLIGGRSYDGLLHSSGAGSF